MKVYQLVDEDFERLLVAIDRDPQHGRDDGNSVALTDDRIAYQEAHRFYNYHIRKWIDNVCK